MPCILVTGSNRGLGLEWVTQYAKLGWRVHATCRHPDGATELARLAEQYPDLGVHRLDVTDPDQIRALADVLDRESIDLLVNNAGVYFERWGRDRLGEIDYDLWIETLRVNTLGAMRVTEALVEQLARSGQRLVATVTSHMGTISDIDTPNDYAYRSSKAALNAGMRGLAHELEPRRIGVLLLHPGWVRTRMGGSSAPLSTEESVSGMRAVVEGFTPAMSGRVFHHNGVELPW